MLYHQVIDIGAYILFLDEKPIEPKMAKIILTGTEDKLVGISFNIQFRLRDLMVHLSNILKRSSEISEEMVDFFLENVPLNRTVATSFNLNKTIFKELEENYYKCETIDQFLKIKPDPTAIVAPLLNLDLYELVGLEIVPEDLELKDDLTPEFSGANSSRETDSLFSYLGVISRLIFIQLGTAIKATLVDLFSAKR